MQAMQKIYANATSSRLILSGIHEYPNDERELTLNPGERIDPITLHLEGRNFEDYRSVRKALEENWLRELSSPEEEVEIPVVVLPPRNEFDIKLDELEDKDAKDLERMRAQNRMRGTGNVVMPPEHAAV